MASTNAPDAAGIDFAGGRGALALRRFASGMQRRVFGGRVLGALLRAALVTAVPALLIAWWLPSLRAALLVAVAAVLAPVAIVTAVRAHLARRRVLLALGRRLAGSPSAATAHDELLTWLEFDARGGGRDARPALLDWLEHDVAARLSPDERRELAAASRPSLGRFAWLLPLVLVLLLAWLLAEWLAPPWDGVLGGNPPPPPPGTASGGGGGGAPGEGEPQRGESEPQDGEPRPEQPPPEEPPPSPSQPPPAPQDPPPPEPAAPLLELPEQQRFVVPEFIDDGPTRRARMRAAELAADGDAAAPPPGAPRSGGEAPPQESPPSREQQFERAAEQALRSRHVPEAERAIVRRFFDKLQQKGR